MNMLSRDKQIRAVAALCEGCSIRAVERMTDVNRATVNRLSLSFGEGAQRLHDRLSRDLTCTQIVADETWSYVGVKEARVRPDHPEGSGEAYTFGALGSVATGIAMAPMGSAAGDAGAVGRRAVPRSGVLRAGPGAAVDRSR